MRYRLSGSFGFQPPLATELGYGKTIHHILERLGDLVKNGGSIPTDAQVESLFDNEFYMPFANRFAFEKLWASARDLVDRYRSDYKDDLLRVWEVERPFSLHLANGVVTGRADVILDYEDGVPKNLALVDYKTATGTEVDGVFAFQLAIYAAAGRGEGLNVQAAYLHRLKEGDRTPVPVDGPTTKAAKDRASSLIEGLVAGSFPAKRVRQNYLYKLTLASLMVYAMIAGCLARKSPHKFGGSIWRCGRKWMNACGDNGRLQSALDGRHKVDPGDTIWILKGTYRHPDRHSGSPGYVVRLQGREGRPISIRAELNQRVTLDGGLSVEAPATWLSIRDLEILVSENFSMSRTLQEPGSSPKTYNRPWGGLNIHSGRGCQYLNLVIHDNAQGISFWSGATDSEVHGCIIYDNGWKAPDRGHGHAIYTQNKDGVKTIANCIMTGGYGFTLHAYGSKQAYVDNYLVRNNAATTRASFSSAAVVPATTFA